MGKKLMVVAHPDDEVIFGGAHLLTERGWKVVCITNGYNKTRANEFERVMKLLGADYDIWNYKDTYSRHFDTVSLERDLRWLVSRNTFERVVTHGLGGEYGHPQHQIIGRIIRKLVPKNLYAFSTSKRALPHEVLQEKRWLLNQYGSQRKTIRELCRDDGLNRYIDKEYFVMVRM